MVSTSGSKRGQNPGRGTVLQLYDHSTPDSQRPFSLPQQSPVRVKRNCGSGTEPSSLCMLYH